MRHVLVCIDHRFVEQLCIQMLSFAQHNQKQSYTYHVFYTELSAAQMDTIRAHASKNLCCRFYPVDQKHLTRFQVSESTRQRLSLATFYRLCVAEILDSRIRQVLYLDADLVVEGALDAMWAEPLEHCLVAAVVDINLVQRSREVLGCDASYFNAGVMMINLDAWRANQCTQSVLDFVTHASPEQLAFNDQDALNKVCSEHGIAYLDKQFNYQTCQVALDAQSDAVVPDPLIIHFTGVDKPWHANSSHTFKQRYRYYREMSQFKSVPMALEMDKRVAEALAALPENSRIGIFGAGEMGRRVLHYASLAKMSVSVICFFDNHTHWREYAGLPIKTVSEEALVPLDYVLIASASAHRAMERDLRALEYDGILNPFAQADRQLSLEEG